MAPWTEIPRAFRSWHEKINCTYLSARVAFVHLHFVEYILAHGAGSARVGFRYRRKPRPLFVSQQHIVIVPQFRASVAARSPKVSVPVKCACLLQLL